MRGFLILILMVMMVALLAPMTAMACLVHDAPVLTMTMANTVPDNAILTREQTRPHQGKTLVSDSHVMITAQAIMSARGFMDNDINIYMRPRATDGKAGGAAIFASGKPRAFADTFI